jgi:cysteinyl-tRNA synthetase
MRIKDIGVSEEDIARLIKERQEARQGKDWARADGIRAELEAKGVLLEDKKDRTDWRIRAGSA